MRWLHHSLLSEEMNEIPLFFFFPPSLPFFLHTYSSFTYQTQHLQNGHGIKIKIKIKVRGKCNGHNVGIIILSIHTFIHVYIGIVEWPARCIHRNTLFLCVWVIEWDFKRDPHNMILPC